MTGTALQGETVNRQTHKRVQIAGVWFDSLTLDQSVRAVVDACAEGRGGWVITANLDHLRRAQRESDYGEMLGEADLVVADGMPIIWASRVQGCALPQRVAGSSMILPLSIAAADKGLRVFLLGGNPGVADQAAEVLKDQCPGLVIAGTDCPPMGFEVDEAYMERLKEKIAGSDSNLIYVALGSPKQERLIREIRSISPNAWWLGIGISLSFLTGEVRRAPSWMQRLGLEWLHRLVQEPKRLAKRYLVDGLPYALVLLLGGLLVRLKGGGRS